MSDTAASALKSPKAIALIVLVLAAIGLIAYNVAGLFSDPASGKADPITETRRSMGEIPGRVGEALTAGVPVDSLEALPPVEGWRNTSVDEWNNPLVYEVKRLPNSDYTLRVRSNGADGLPDTADDIIMTSKLERIPGYNEWVPGLTEFEGPEFTEGGGD